jgi:exodeoxyribonuclease III
VARLACGAVLIATWNVNSLRARLPRVLEFLELHRPDVLLMQETKLDPGGFPRLDLEAAGYEAADHSGGRWAGVAIASRHGLADVAAGLPGEPDALEARWIEATVAGLRIASVYVPNGREVGTDTFAAKLAFLEAMAGRSPALDVLGGDMNVCPTDEDVYDPALFAGATHVTEDERSRLRAVMAGGLVDAFRVRTPAGQGFTWWDYRQGHFHRGFGLRIDLLLVRDALASRIDRCGIDRDFRKGPKPSDHAPLLLHLED